MAAEVPARLASQESGKEDLAPDGRPGFGREVDESSLLRLFRTPDEADQIFLSELRSLAEDVGILVSITEGFYRERRYFNLLGSAQRGDLEQLLSSYRAYSLDPSSAINQGQAVSMAFARMHLDTRFRTRIDILREWGYEASQLRSGLRVLEGAASSFVVLGDNQARSVARRIDLAAARLRNMRLDLEAMRESMESARTGGPDPHQVKAFLALFEIGDRDARLKAIEAERLRAQTEEKRMTSVLFTTKLKVEAAPELEWRVNSNAQARDLLEDALEALPESDDDVPAELRRLGKTKRRKYARERSIEGLELDPLNEELAWIAGRTSQLVFGEFEAASHYDRFLTLRGIRHYQEATFRERDLTEREREALRFLDQLEQRVNPLNPGQR